MAWDFKSINRLELGEASDPQSIEVFLVVEAWYPSLFGDDGMHDLLVVAGSSPVLQVHVYLFLPTRSGVLRSWGHDDTVDPVCCFCFVSVLFVLLQSLCWLGP